MPLSKTPACYAHESVTMYQALSTQELSPRCPHFFSLIMFSSSIQCTGHFLLSPPGWQDGSSEIRGVNPLGCIVPRLSRGNVAGEQIQLNRPVWGPMCKPKGEHTEDNIKDETDELKRS